MIPYNHNQALYTLKIASDMNFSKEQTEQMALAIARKCGREAEMQQELEKRYKNKFLGVYRSTGESLEEFMFRVCRSESALEQELTLDEKPAENGKRKNPDKWLDYWGKVKDGRIPASMGDLYANFKIIKKMREQGTAEERAKAQLYLNSLREDFAWHEQEKEGGLIADTRLFYSANSLDTRVVQHYKCTMPELTKEKIIEFPVYRGRSVEEVAKSDSGLICLQTVLDTEDDAETTIQTLEFISGKGRKNIVVWTALAKNDDNSYYTRAEKPERAVWFDDQSIRLDLDCYYYPIYFTGRSRRVRRCEP